MFRTAILTVLLCVCSTGWVTAQQEAAKAPRTGDAQQSKPASQDLGVAGQGQEKLSDAERITRLQRTIEENEKLLSELKATLEDPAAEYAKAEAEFKKLDKELETQKKALQKLADEGKQDEAAALAKEVEALQQRWKLSKERFDLAIQERKTLQEQIVTLEQRIKQDRQALDKLLAPPTTQPASAPAAPPTTTPATPSGEPGTQPEAVEPKRAPVLPGILTPGGPPAEPGQEQPGQPAEPAKPPSEELVEAQREAQARAAEAETAKQEVESVTARIEQVRKQIEQGRTLLETARKKADNADQTRRTLTEQVQKRSADGAPQAELQELWAKIAEARQRYRDAQDDVDKRVEQIDQLQDELQRLQQEQIGALQKEKEAAAEAAKAREKVKELRNPFSPRNLVQWFVIHGPKVAGILVGMLVVLWLGRVLERRMVKLLAARGGPGTQVERENRARTLVSVLHNTVSVVVVVGGILMILSEVGLPIVPLMGGAAVVGLAIAFGAQNLVRDYFTGFMILLESQYGVNDVVKIAGVAGLVERVTLRVTILRDLEGIVHFVPNGQITTVSNLTHGWSRVVLDIGVAYKEDVDQVMRVITDVGKELRYDPNFRHLILDDLEMLGVDAFTDSAVIIKAIVKTRPLQQWTVKRAMMRRLKKKFDELGIEIPFPHRTIFHRYESGPPPSSGVESGERPSEARP
jgi:small-conductance mechanosensitive channel/predicted  nucleic acid-binding Zn-ribbon protein